MKVRVRMYTAGLGDCFLISFAPDTDRAVHVLIDCGVLLGTKNAEKAVKERVRDIHAVTAHLDVVIATHEHWDHVSGFLQAKEVFDTFTIGQIWLAWTEAPDDELAEKLRSDRAKRKKNLGAALKMWKQKVGAGPLRGDPSRAATRVAMTEAVLAFGDPDMLGLRGKTSDCFNYLKQRQEPKEYLEPATSRLLPGRPDVRVFVLGPPRDEKLLKKGRPSTRTPETYSEGEQALTMASSFFAAVESASSPESTSVRSNVFAQPFDDYHRIEARQPAEIDQLKGRGSVYGRYHDAAEDWRTIDNDWLNTTSDLAIALDNDTNNTSLVLAFELGENGDVLLFPADAQVGNWLSWKDMIFDVRQANARRSVTTAQLLARTVFYKVGHHASHNATLREHGLERMTHEGLIAMIPIEKGMAAQQEWNMPFPPLFERLNERCKGRVLRLDDGMPDRRRLRRLSAAERQAFEAQVDASNPLFVELNVDTG